MANPRPTPKPENLRPPWPPGTSGNAAGYSRGRRISDAIERLIEEMALDREFGATAIAMALGKKYRKSGVSPSGNPVSVHHILPKKLNRHRITRKKLNRHRITRRRSSATSGP